MKIIIDEVKQAKITSSALLQYDTLSLDTIDLEIGKEGIEELLKSIMWQFKKVYGDDNLIEILQDPDFNSITDILVVDEVAELDTEIRILKEDLQECQSNLACSEVLVGSYQDFRD